MGRRASLNLEIVHEARDSMLKLKSVGKPPQVPDSLNTFTISRNMSRHKIPPIAINAATSNHHKQ